MKIAVVSGKGGTGKTTVAVSLALALAGERTVWLLDCDVEAPNAHLFLHPQINRQAPAVTLIPQIDKERCTVCGRCVEVCAFHALAKIGKTLMTFPQLCHGCGSCTWNCPEGAISELPHPIGELEAGEADAGIHFAHGRLTISEPMATPIIRQLKRWVSPAPSDVVIFDAPPGASCSVVETLRGADAALLVTEPTPFGLHDLRQILGILREMRIPGGVVINRDGIGDDMVDHFLRQSGLQTCLRIPFEPQYAAGIASGKALVHLEPGYRPKFKELYNQLLQIVRLPLTQEATC